MKMLDGYYVFLDRFFPLCYNPINWREKIHSWKVYNPKLIQGVSGNNPLIHDKLRNLRHCIFDTKMNKK